MIRSKLKKLATLFIAAALILTPLVARAQPNGKTIMLLNGEPISLEAYLKDGYHYVHPREAAEALGLSPAETGVGEDYRRLRDIALELDFSVTWEEESRMVNIDTSKGYGENGEPALSQEEILQIADDAYVYTLPLVIMDLTIRNLTNVSESTGEPINQFGHNERPANADDRSVVRPNIDTPYSSACLDLSGEPLVFKKPETDRYCSVAIYDAYTNCAAILGTGGLDNGKEAAYLLCGPDYTGPVPQGLVRVSIPTNMAWMLVRTEYKDENDLPNVRAIQNKLSLVPLSQADNPNYVPPKGSYDPENDYVPFEKIKALDVETFFDTFSRLAAANPATEDDKPSLESFAKIGIGPGLDFEPDTFSGETQEILKGYPSLIIARLMDMSGEDGSRFFSNVNNWKYSADNIARFGTDYEFRAIVAIGGLGANPVEMAVYPSADVDADNEPLDGRNNYSLRFEKGQLPPCNAFWSITAYDKDGFLVHNPIEKYAIRSGDGFTVNPDGSIDIYIQPEPPGEARQENWLPVPKDAFQLTLRIYLPKEEVLDLSWKPPYIVKSGA